MPLYEHVFMTRQDVSTQQVETLGQDFKKIIEEGGGKVVGQEYWGLRPLAYKIKKNRKAHYTMLNIDSNHDAVAEMERRMSLSTDILRFLTIRVDEHSSEPSAMMRKNDRDDRRGGRPPFKRDGDRPPFKRDGDRPPFKRDGDRPPFKRDGDVQRAPAAASAAPETTPEESE